MTVLGGQSYGIIVLKIRAIGSTWEIAGSLVAPRFLNRGGKTTRAT